MIDVDAITVRFRTQTGPFDAVRGASFHVDEGEVFGLVGESGSGKSTILRALTGLAPIVEGRAQIAGHAVGAKPDRAFRRNVQMVFQDRMGRCIRASRWTRRCVSRSPSTGLTARTNALSMRCAKWGWGRHSGFATRISFRADSGSAWRLHGR